MKLRLRKNKKKMKEKRHKCHLLSLKFPRDQVCRGVLCSLNFCKLGVHVASLIFGILSKDDGDGPFFVRVYVLLFKAVVIFSVHVVFVVDKKIT